MGERVISIQADPIIHALAEEVQALLLGREVNIEWYDVHRKHSHPAKYVQAITINSCYHYHVIYIVDSTLYMDVQHKHRKSPLDKIKYQYDLTDPKSLDGLFEELERTSEHAP